ncbi:MAG: O-antigen ligase family protein [Actinomycetia bacterium]|nr:O-antigen ligase family protein [Actinomycetes bacterium]
MMAVVAAVLPFEASTPVISVLGHNIRSVYAVAGLAVLIAAPGVLRARRAEPEPARHQHRRFEWLGMALIGLLALSWLTANGYGLQAGMSWRRLATGILVAMVTARLASTASTRRLILVGYLVGATVAATVGLIDSALSAPTIWLGVDWLGWLDRMWGQPTMFGPIERLTQPFGHANVAAGHYSVAVIIALGLAGQAVAHRRHWLAALALAAATTTATGLSRTYSRGAVMALLVALVCALLLGLTDKTWRSLVAGALVAMTVIGLVDSTWALRFRDQPMSQFYGVQIDAPADIAALPASTVSVTNQSSSLWPPEVQSLERIELATDGRVIVRHLYELPELQPGESAEVAVDDPHPDPATAIVAWDVVRPGQGHFLTLTGAAPVTTPASAVRIPSAPPSRFDLWSASIHLVGQNPLLGVGPGNFRLHYQTVLDRPGPRTAHAHSIVFEPLASWGVVAAIVFVAMIVGGLVIGVRHRYDDTHLIATLSLIAVVAMGLFDWLVASAAGGLTLWLVLGLVWSAGVQGRVGEQIVDEAGLGEEGGLVQ